MKSSIYLRVILLLSLGGVLFAGYLSLAKLLTGTCALSEPCPYFLGYPACWYGLAMYAAMFIITARAIYRENFINLATKLLTLISGLGILFAGYFTLGEVSVTGIWGYTLGLSTCTYGLIFYLLIFGLSVKKLLAK